MKNRNARLARLIVVLVFGVGLVLFTTAILAGRAQEPRSFVATYMVSNNGAPTSIRAEFVKATGEWRNTAYGLGAGATRTLIDTLDAQYQIGPASIDFLTSADADQTRNLDRAFRTVAFHKNHPEFVREEFVAGLKTYVHRAVHADGSGAWVENFYAPETGLTALKTVMHHGDGTESVIEAINVQFRDVSTEEVALPNLPIRFDMAEQMVKDSRLNGNAEAADQLAKQIELAKQKHSVR